MKSPALMSNGWSEADAYQLALDLLKSLDCPAPIFEALDIWWMMRRAEVVKLHNWCARAEGQIVEAEPVVQALPPGKGN